MYNIHNTLEQEAQSYEDTPENHKDRVARFNEYVNATPLLKEHRDFCEKHVYGFGERSFHWMWKLIVDTLPNDFSFLEIGVYKGQVLSLIRLLSDCLHTRESEIFGVTPLSNYSGPTGKFPEYPETNYMQHIMDLHDHFGQKPYPTIIQGFSQDPEIIALVHTIAGGLGELAEFDVVYIDGSHEFEEALLDLKVYPELVRIGGYLVVDDASCYLNMYPGSFAGIEDVSRAVQMTVQVDPRFEHLLAVMHNRVWRRIK